MCPDKRLTLEEMDLVFDNYKNDISILRYLQQELERYNGHDEIQFHEKICRRLEELDDSEDIDSTSNNPAEWWKAPLTDVKKIISHHIVALKIEIEAIITEEKEKKKSEDCGSNLTLKLLKRYQKLQNGEFPAFNFNMFRMIHGVAGQQQNVEVSNPLFVERQGLNDEQWRAVKHAHSSDLTMLWGPPGTRKAEALIPVINNFYKQGKSILIVGPTKRAAENLLERFCVVLKKEQDPGLHEGKVQRLGQPIEKSLKQDFGEFVFKDGIVDRHKREWILLVDSCEKKLAQKRSSCQEKVDWLKVYEEVENIPDNREPILRELLEMDDAAGCIRLENAQKDRVIQEIESMSLLDKVLDRIWCFFLRRQSTKHLGRQLQLELKIAQGEAQLARIIKKGQEAAQKLDRLGDLEHHLTLQLQMIDSPAILETDIEEINKDIAAEEKKLAGLRFKMENIESSVTNDAQVLAMTTKQAYLRYKGKTSYDVVIMDEVSMITLPETAIIAGMAREHVVLAGDFCQLAPIYKSNNPIVRQWIGSTIFDTTGVVAAVDEKQQHVNCIYLCTQYRMIGEIFYLDNELIYRGMLRRDPGAGVVDRTYPEFLKHNVKLIDTSLLNPRAEYVATGESSGRTNTIHADGILKFVANILEGGGVEAENIGIITPYVAQADLIKKKLSEVHLSSVGVGTVHTFQANQREVVIYDIADSEGTTPSQLVCGNNLYDNSTKLLNVALSRASSKLVIVANLKYLKSRPELEKSFTLKLVKMVEQMSKESDLVDVYIVPKRQKNVPSNLAQLKSATHNNQGGGAIKADPQPVTINKVSQQETVAKVDPKSSETNVKPTKKNKERRCPRPRCGKILVVCIDEDGSPYYGCLGRPKCDYSEKI